jgi:MYXO-CTERM domain-containing protein
MQFGNISLGAIALIGLGAIATPAFADDVFCTPNQGPVTVDGNVIVTGECELEGTRVIGNVHVYPGGSLVARGVHVDGNIQAEGGDFVDVAESHVDGNIQLDDLTGSASIIDRVRVGGNIQVVGNQVGLSVVDNIVGADMQAFSNFGGVDITGNTFDGNLQCKENAPAPTGSNNQVAGNSEDQCENLAPGDGSTGGGSGGGNGTIDGDVNCPPELGRVTVDGNVQVTGACRLEGTIVKGNVLLYAGGSLVARDGVIDGNIQAAQADFVDVSRVTVKGSIQLDDLVGDLSMIRGTDVDGNIQLNGNRSVLEVVDNVVDGDVQGFSNTGGLLIADNVIRSNLQCKSNSPAPVGGNNQVFGNREDQCADLQGGREADVSAGGVDSGGATSGTAASSGGGGATSLLWLLGLLGLGVLVLWRRRAG